MSEVNVILPKPLEVFTVMFAVFTFIVSITPTFSFRLSTLKFVRWTIFCFRYSHSIKFCVCAFTTHTPDTLSTSFLPEHGKRTEAFSCRDPPAKKPVDNTKFM
jgi:hypothetical protein